MTVTVTLYLFAVMAVGLALGFALGYTRGSDDERRSWERAVAKERKLHEEWVTAHEARLAQHESNLKEVVDLR